MFGFGHRSTRISDLRKAIDAHVDGLSQEAPIRVVLGSDEIQSRIVQFDWADAIALKEQRSYRGFRLLALWATMVATFVGAFTLLPLQEGLAPWQRSLIQVLQAVAVILSFIATIWVGVRQSVQQWLQSRAVAERLRGDVFRALIRGGGKEPTRLLAPALACFKDAHLNWQIDFYAERAARYRRRAGGFDPYKMAGYLLLAVAVLFGSVVLLKWAASELKGQWPQLHAAVEWIRLEHPERYQLGLSAMATSILAFATMRSFIDVDDRNASVYPLTAAALQGVRAAGLENAEAAAAGGDPAKVMDFYDSVQSILDKEHLAWMRVLPAEPLWPAVTGTISGR
jgi:hypothetical protein